MSTDKTNAVIELVDVEKSFGTQKVLNKVNLTVREGTTTVIVGASGQGKSVILKHMLGLVKPDAGKVLTLAGTIGFANDEPGAS